jgi:hypothetical protein
MDEKQNDASLVGQGARQTNQSLVRCRGAGQPLLSSNEQDSQQREVLKHKFIRN